MKTMSFINECEIELQDIFNEIDNQSLKNSEKVINAFHEAMLSESDLHGTNGYGYNDTGREKIEQIFSSIFGSEASLVRNQLVSGSHAINVTLQALLRPNDTLLSITGTPYDTLHEVIGIKENNSSLMSYNVTYKQIELKDNDPDIVSFDYEYSLYLQGFPENMENMRKELFGKNKVKKR